MNKLKSFGAALVLLLVFVLIVNGLFERGSLKMDNRDFGFWFNAYKDMSYAALSENMEKDTVLLLGSSEFRHGRKTAYYPRNMFRKSNFKLVSVGGPWNQTLFHTIALGSLEKKMKSRKVILLVSPTWFKTDGVDSNGYAFRFSETEYIRFMENKDIPDEVKKYVANRTESLLRPSLDKYTQVRLINRNLLHNSRDPVTRTLFLMEKRKADRRDYAAVSMAMKAMKLDLPVSGAAGAEPPHEPMPSNDWGGIMTNAINASGRRSNNPFYMSDRSWKQKYRKIYRSGRSKFGRKTDVNSPEFGDYEAFLKICRANHIDAKIIVLPVNGRWYDYIGTTKAIRKQTTDKIIRLGKKYGVETSDLSKFDYENFVTRDAQHPWNVGCVLIDEQIYNFCKEN